MKYEELEKREMILFWQGQERDEIFTYYIKRAVSPDQQERHRTVYGQGKRASEVKRPTLSSSLNMAPSYSAHVVPESGFPNHLASKPEFARKDSQT